MQVLNMQISPTNKRLAPNAQVIANTTQPYNMHDMQPTKTHAHQSPNIHNKHNAQHTTTHITPQHTTKN